MKKYIYKSISKKQFADAYGITPFTFNKWLTPIRKEIGEYRARCYTPKQVEKIVHLLGEPEKMELISIT